MALGSPLRGPLNRHIATLTYIYTVTADLAVVPGISIPCGMTKPRQDEPPMPVGMQLLGKHFDKERLLQVAHAFEGAGGSEVS